MFENCKKYSISIFALLLLISAIFISHIDWQNSHRILTVTMFDIGQGDAIFIESSTGTQVLFDGGPPKKIISQLQKVMPRYDKSIDALVITNPDEDHIGGFLDVLKNYEVGSVFEPGTINDSKIYQNIKEEIKIKNIPNILAKKGMHLDIGGGAFIDILFPDRNVFDWPTNDGSIVARLSYGKNSIMLTGDATQKTEKIILSGNLSSSLESNILKVGHHGSKTSTSSLFVKAVSPQYALISDGKNNKYGHPHKETLNTLNAFGSKVFRTDILGNILMKIDGNNINFSFYK